jgi:lysophospholipase
MSRNTCFLSEDDFLDVITTENEEFIREHVKRATHRAKDGTELNYYTTCPDNHKATVVIVHGMGEFFDKYREYIWYLYRSGFQVFFMEQRGHGYSGGKAPEHDVIYIDSYNTYVEDLHGFITQEVKPAAGQLPLFLIAHSMGGCVGTLFLEKYPDVFDAAILSSPMLKMSGADYSPLAQKFIALYALLFGKTKKLAPNQHHFNPDAKVEGSSAKSEARFYYQLDLRKKDPHYQTAGATFGWALASMKATDKAIKKAGNIKIPVTVMTAGHDHLINPAGYERFKEKVPQALFHHYEESRHEIFNSDDETRKKYFADVLDTLEGYLKNSD